MRVEHYKSLLQGGGITTGLTGRSFLLELKTCCLISILFVIVERTTQPLFPLSPSLLLRAAATPTTPTPKLSGGELRKGGGG